MSYLQSAPWRSFTEELHGGALEKYCGLLEVGNLTGGDIVRPLIIGSYRADSVLDVLQIGDGIGGTIAGGISVRTPAATVYHTRLELEYAAHGLFRSARPTR